MKIEVMKPSLQHKILRGTSLDRKVDLSQKGMNKEPRQKDQGKVWSVLHLTSFP